MKKIGIFGTNGFAREVADVAFDNGYQEVVLISSEHGDREVAGFPVVYESELDATFAENFDVAIGVGDGKIREKIANKFPNFNYVNLIHSSVSMGRDQDAQIKKSKGLIICAGTRLTNDIEIGDFVVLNLNVTVGHEAVLDSYVSCMPGVNISGCVQLCKGSFIGTGATVLPGKSVNEKLVIGANAVVGAGSLVRKSVEDAITVVGNPAKPLMR